MIDIILFSALIIHILLLIKHNINMLNYLYYLKGLLIFSKVSGSTGSGIRVFVCCEGDDGLCYVAIIKL